jgi:hypothetical protein
MKTSLLLGTSILAMVAAFAVDVAPASAADMPVVIEPVAPAPVLGHRFAGTVTAGVMWTRDQIDYSGGFDDDDDDDDDDDVNWNSFFGEAAVLFGPEGTNFNFQGDFSFHSHSPDFGSGFGPSGNTRLDSWHAGGIAFWRDANVGLVGIDGSFISNDYFGSVESWRLGLRGEYFVDPSITVGGGAGYVTMDFFGKADGDGFDGNLWARYYFNDSFAMKVRGDVGSLSFDDGPYEDVTAWAIAGEGEYLLPSLPMSVFVGVRYAKSDVDASPDYTVDSLQVYGGAKFYFGSGDAGTSLATHHRNNTLDNTSTFLERMPLSLFTAPKIF